MILTEKLKTVGEHPFTFPGKAGKIEGILTVPPSMNDAYVAFLGHPHSLQGGSMNNKVVTTLARVFKELHIPSLRFNFRGVGQSEGVYDQGIGESEDMLDLVSCWQQERDKARLLFAGFSFGSYVAYRAAAQSSPQLLVTIAPPIHHYDYEEFRPLPQPWIIVQGQEDEVVPAQAIIDFAVNRTNPLIVFEKTGHFFHGKLIDLKTQLIEAIRTQISVL